MRTMLVTKADNVADIAGAQSKARLLEDLLSDDFAARLQRWAVEKERK